MNNLGMPRESRSVVLHNRLGMHVRPAGIFARVALRFAADVQVEHEGIVVSGESILGLISLGAACGAVLRVTAVGPQARDALDALERLIERRFDIPET